MAIKCFVLFGSSGRIRTYNPSVNSRRVHSRLALQTQDLDARKSNSVARTSRPLRRQRKRRARMSNKTFRDCGAVSSDLRCAPWGSGNSRSKSQPARQPINAVSGPSPPVPGIVLEFAQQRRQDQESGRRLFWSAPFAESPQSPPKMSALLLRNPVFISIVSYLFLFFRKT